MKRNTEILQFLHYHPVSSRNEISSGLINPPSDSTLKRIISELIKEGKIEAIGSGRATRYKLAPQSQLTMTAIFGAKASKNTLLR